MAYNVYIVSQNGSCNFEYRRLRHTIQHIAYFVTLLSVRDWDTVMILFVPSYNLNFFSFNNVSIVQKYIRIIESMIFFIKNLQKAEKNNFGEFKLCILSKKKI